MKKIFPALLSIAILSVSVQEAFGQKFPYGEYKTRTLGELVDMDSDLRRIVNPGKRPMLIHAKPFYSAVRVTYTGEKRAMSADRLSLFRLWQGSLSIDPKVLRLLSYEYKFIECGQEHWLAVQKQVANYFPKELKSGDRITLYLMAVGGLGAGDTWESVFLTNEFQKY